MNYLELSAHRENPAVTIMLGMPNDEKSAEKYKLVLKNLVKQIILELEEREGTAAKTMIRKIDQVLKDFQPTHKRGSIVYFISPSVNEQIEVPFVLESQFVIDAYFHTKEILRSESKMNHYYVLTIGMDCSRLLEYVDDTLIQEVKDAHFPIRNKGYWTKDRVLNSMGSVQTNYKKEFFKWIDSELQPYLNRHPHPIILAGTTENIATYKQISHKDERIVGEIYGNFTVDSGENELAIGEQANQVIHEYIRHQKETILHTIVGMENQGRVERDVANIYRQVIKGKGQKLIVDHAYYQEAVIRDHQVKLVDISPSDEGYVEDIINEIIYEVMRYGGEVIFAETEVLENQSPILLQLRY